MIRYKSPAAPVSARERELLEILIEECSEVIKRASKIKRFGPLEIQAGKERTNRDRLALEVGDLTHMIQVLVDEKYLDEAVIDEGRLSKIRQLATYLQTERENF